MDINRSESLDRLPNGTPPINDARKASGLLDLELGKVDALSRSRSSDHIPDRRRSATLAPPMIPTMTKKVKTEPWVHVLRALSIACVIWIVLRTFTPKPFGSLESNGTLCPRDTICATEWWLVALLAVSRCSAYLCYPLMMLLFITKTNNLRTLLLRNPISLFVPLYDLHQIHVLCGEIVGVAVLIHGVCHMLRWALQGQIHFLWEHVTGITGGICFLLTPLISWPMVWQSLKAKLSWELRKSLHYLSIVWGITIMFHAPQMHIRYLMGFPVTIYIADWVYGFFCRTYLVDKAVSFTRLECGVELTFEHPHGFKSDGAGYIMICIPWINKWEWHPFSLFAHPSKPGHSCVCMCMHGDWTKALHDKVKVPTTRPVFIAGPFASPYATANKYDNLILVASGIGITPALSIIAAHKEAKRVNLIWSCREPSLIEFYLKTTAFDDDAWTLIYYTGKRRLMLDFEIQKTVLIFSGRPDLEHSVLEIIASIELSTGLPEDEVEEADAVKLELRSLAEELSLNNAHDAYSKFSILLKRCLCTHSTAELKGVITDHTDDHHGHHILKSAEFEVIDILEELMPGAFTDAEIRELVDHFDIDDDGHVSLDNFRESCFAMLTTMNSASGELENQSRSDRISTADLIALSRGSGFNTGSHERFGTKVKNKDLEASIPPEVFKNWKLLYCGGSQPVVDSLKAISTKTGMKFHAEKFDW